MLANNPGLSDAASELERAGGAMREMGDAQREAYARGLGIDPSLIPMLTRDVSGLRDMFRSHRPASRAMPSRKPLPSSAAFAASVPAVA